MINEKRLTLLDSDSCKYITGTMDEYFSGEEVDPAESSVAHGNQAHIAIQKFLAILSLYFE
ncbi:hypothetical protein [Endozoicomonas sp. 8E]|uniref:hypothetical protein n=1 Tax=Endozoicomonas sp. 8E TaxID=3035692 RepID=UPI003977D3AB